MKKDKNGIKVYTRTLDSTKFNEYKAVMQVKAPLDSVLKTITDGNELVKWCAYTSDSKVLETINKNQYILWVKNDMPWPIKNRDHVSIVTIKHQKNGDITIDLDPETAKFKPDPESSTIRITNFKGQWLLHPQNNTIEITQQLYGDPNGTLPAWLVNSMLVNAPYHSFEKLKELLEN
uniref:START domain-containing protein n=1 Tax=Zhouia sp. PK063 TaxID=3373602 RepID=UPI0037DC3AD9